MVVQEELHLHELVYTHCTKTVVDIVGCMHASYIIIYSFLA